MWNTFRVTGENKSLVTRPDFRVPSLYTVALLPLYVRSDKRLKPV